LTEKDPKCYYFVVLTQKENYETSENRRFAGAGAGTYYRCSKHKQLHGAMS
jgi:hypothetical protein